MTTEIQPVEPRPEIVVFNTGNPSDVIEKATNVANILAPIVEKAKLYNNISGRRFVRAEGWSTMAAMLGVFPHLEYCRRLDREGEVTYEARVILRHLDGKEIGAGEALASSKENKPWSRDEFSVKSMAQTRAIGKACRLSFSWVMALAGFESCPAEEIDASMIKPSIRHPMAKPQPVTNQAPKPAAVMGNAEPTIEFGDAEVVESVVVEEQPQVLKAQRAFNGKITEKQQKFLFFKWKSAGGSNDQLKDELKKRFNIEHTKDMTRSQMDELLAHVETM